MKASRVRALVGLASLFAAPLACIVEPEPTVGLQTFRVEVVTVNDADPPSADAPLPANTGFSIERIAIEVQAIGSDGEKADFDGYVRVSIEPGAIAQVVGASGPSPSRNLKLKNGKVNAILEVTAVYGPTRVVVEDLGYRPGKPGKTPQCANGENDDPDEDVFVDYPNDSGCAFADDDTETGGTFSAGASEPVSFALPTLRDLQGGSETPFPFEGLEVKSDDPQYLVVTRIAKDGFYVTDLADQGRGANHLFAFSFSTPPGLRVCDRITYLAGTMSEFFGFTEMNFPSFGADRLFEGDEENCLVPEPIILDSPDPDLDPRPIDDEAEMEKAESGLVRVVDYVVAGKFGPKPAIGNVFAEDQSNCDLNGDGRVDFEAEAEGSCGEVCAGDPDCTEWTQYISRGSYKVHREAKMIMIQTDGAPGFNPVANRGATLNAVTGSLRNFSGGDLNWTIEARCPDDLVCGLDGCAEEIKAPNVACVKLRPTEDDNDEGTN